MLEKLTIEEARHILSDFFEIHTEETQKKALSRAIQILDDIEAGGGKTVVFGALPTLRVGDSLLSCLPKNYDPEKIYLVHKESSNEGYSKRISFR